MSLKGLVDSQDHPIIYRLIQVLPQANSLLSNSCPPKKAFKQEVDKMPQAGILKPVQEATPWINSFVLVESKDRSGNLNLHICLDTTNLNKAITKEPYHFRTPEGIAHLLTDACIMTVCDSKKGH